MNVWIKKPIKKILKEKPDWCYFPSLTKNSSQDVEKLQFIGIECGVLIKKPSKYYILNAYDQGFDSILFDLENFSWTPENIELIRFVQFLNMGVHFVGSRHLLHKKSNLLQIRKFKILKKYVFERKDILNIK